MLLIPDKLERDIGFYLVKIQHPRSSTCNILICIKIVACIFEVIAFPEEQKQFDYQHWNFLGSLCKAHSKKFVGKRQIVWVKMSMKSFKFSWWSNKEKLFLFHSADILYIPTSTIKSCYIYKHICSNTEKQQQLLFKKLWIKQLIDITMQRCPCKGAIFLMGHVALTTHYLLCHVKYL